MPLALCAFLLLFIIFCLFLAQHEPQTKEGFTSGQPILKVACDFAGSEYLIRRDDTEIKKTKMKSTLHTVKIERSV